MTTTLATGCWDAQDIEDRDIALAVVLDKTTEGYVFCIEVASITSKIQNPQSEQGSQQPSRNTIIVHASGQNLAEARMNLDNQLNKPIFIGAVQSLIFTENVAKSGIEEYVYRVRQMNEYRKTVDVIVTPDTPDDFLIVQPENASSVGFAVEFTLENLVRKGKAIHLSLQDLLQKLSSKNKCHLINTLSKRHNQITLLGYTAFRDGKSIGFIPYEQSKGIVYLLQDKTTPKFTYEVSVQDNRVTVEASRKRKKIDTVYKNGKVQFNINMEFEIEILHTAENNPVTQKVAQEIRDNLGKMIEADISDTLRTSREDMQCDYLSFSEAFRIRYPDAYEKVDWDSTFVNATFNIRLDIDIPTSKAIDYNPWKDQGGLR